MSWASIGYRGRSLWAEQFSTWRQFLRRVTRADCEKVVEIIISWQAIKEAIYKNAQIELRITDVYVTYSDLYERYPPAQEKEEEEFNIFRI